MLYYNFKEEGEEEDTVPVLMIYLSEIIIDKF